MPPKSGYVIPLQPLIRFQNVSFPKKEQAMKTCSGYPRRMP